MAFSQDGGILSYQELLIPQGGEIPLFASSTVLQMVLDKGEAVTKGKYLELAFSRYASCEAIQLTGNGADVIPAGVGPTMDSMNIGWIYTHFEPTVFGKEQLESVSSDPSFSLKEKRLKSDSITLAQDIEHWRLNGARRSGTNKTLLRTAGSTAGMQTLNGNVTWANAVNSATTDRGFVQQLVPASQTGNVQGLAVGDDFVNQYAAGASWSAGTTPAALSGLITSMRDLSSYDENRGLQMSVDTGIADSISFMRLENYLHDSVRVVSVSEDQFKNPHQFLPYGGVKIYSSGLLNPTLSSWTGTDAASTGSTDGGLIYIFASKALQSRLTVADPQEWVQLVGVGQNKSCASMTLVHQLICQRLPLVGCISKTRIV